MGYRERKAALQRAVTAAFSSLSATALIGQYGEIGIVVRTLKTLLASRLMPPAHVDIWKIRVAFRRGMHARDLQPVGDLHARLEDIAAADHHDLADAALVGVRARKGEGSVKAGRKHGARRPQA